MWGRMFWLIGLLILIPVNQVVKADYSIPQSDRTPTTPLTVPDPAISNLRYISGFGLDNSFTIFYEDRNDTAGCPAGTFRIYFNKTISGPFGFSALSQATNICDSHFLAKDWPITVGVNTYNYRAWGAGNYSGQHNFYVSNDMITWALVSTFTFSHPSDGILYGFHDIVRINNHYIGFVESAGGHSYIVESDKGDQSWVVVTVVGGIGAADRLRLPGSNGPIPTGNILLVQLDGQPTYVKLYVGSDRKYAYLMINRAAAQAANSVLAESAFEDPNNWTWRDGSTGLPNTNNAVLTGTLGSGPLGHDIREVWTVPTSSTLMDNIIVYTATYTGTVTHGIGCAAASNDCQVNFVSPISKPSNNSDKRNISDPPNSKLPIPLTGFPPGKITNVETHVHDVTPNASEIRLEIPSLYINVPILGSRMFNGFWDISWLGNQASYLNGTAFPTLPGNSVIAGHIVTADGKPGPFTGLHTLRYGDEIYIHAWGYKYLYQVREYKLVEPDDQSVFQHEEYSWITLVTCEGYDQVNESYWWRRIVRAVEIDVTKEK
jgi:LPXTG-site transpeptidase (sortase) family protein